ncbi:uncharacterized protein ISCGN_017064 [Ixodes scapularis]
MPLKGRTCYVPGCKSGYKSCTVKASLFRPPKDAFRRVQWAQNIKRADKDLTSDCAVCERHFEEHFIDRTFRHIIGGEIVEMPRDRPQLKSDAIPTVFPDAPKYFTKKAHIKRKERNLCEQGPPPAKKKKRTAANDAGPSNQQDAGETTAQGELPDEAKVDCICGNLLLPDACWNRLRFSVEPGTVFFGLCEQKGECVDHMLLPKLVKFKQANDQPGQ